MGHAAVGEGASSAQGGVARSAGTLMCVGGLRAEKVSREKGSTEFGMKKRNQKIKDGRRRRRQTGKMRDGKVPR